VVNKKILIASSLQTRNIARTTVIRICLRDAHKTRSFAFSRSVLSDIYSLLSGNVISTTIGIVEREWRPDHGAVHSWRRRISDKFDRRQTSQRKGVSTQRQTWLELRISVLASISNLTEQKYSLLFKTKKNTACTIDCLIELQCVQKQSL